MQSCALARFFHAEAERGERRTASFASEIDSASSCGRPADASSAASAGPSAASSAPLADEVASWRNSCERWHSDAALRSVSSAPAKQPRAVSSWSRAQ